MVVLRRLIPFLLLLGIPQTARATTLEDRDSDTLRVRVEDARTGAALAGVLLTLEPAGRSGVTSADGVLVFEGLPQRPLSLRAVRQGYAPREVTLPGRRQAESFVLLQLEPSVLEVAGFVVSGTGRTRAAAESHQPVNALSGQALERALGSSVPASLTSVPGFHLQYNGPAASRPTIRGMGGDRVLMLEDGQSSGDLYQTASDHGVMVEPLTAQRIEVIRGPASLLYGSQALGGVVNVIRDDIPEILPFRSTGSVGTVLESGSPGGGTGGTLLVPVGRAVLRMEGVYRSHRDTRTPLGTLEDTGLEARSGSLGASWIPDWGTVGASIRHYQNAYGVPGSFQGNLIPGGHPGGVRIETDRTTLRLRGSHVDGWLDFFDAVEVDASVTRFNQQEIEGVRPGGRNLLGARFGQTTIQGRVQARHDHSLHNHDGPTIRAEGALGAGVRWRGLETGGPSPGARSGDDLSIFLMGYEELAWDILRLQASVRLEHRRLTPKRTNPIQVRTQQRTLTREVTPRGFTTLAHSVGLLATVTPSWTLGASFARSVRPPSLEELYSDGPHLADFSFDIGNPALDAEVGWGWDLFIRGSRKRLDLEITGFLNQVSDYIAYTPTGETVRVLRDGEAPRTTPVYEATAQDTRFVGVEGRLHAELLPQWVWDAQISYTRAHQQSTGDPVAFIPPLTGRAELRFSPGAWYLALGTQASASQDRVPRAIPVGDAMEVPQNPTAGFVLMHLAGGWRISHGQWTHSLHVQVENLRDQAWRDHLSRIKDVAPQPGRSAQFTWRVYF